MIDEQTAAFRRESELKDLAAVMSSRGGRRVMYRILRYCAFGDNPLVHGDSHVTHVNIGLQLAGNFINNELMEACPEKVINMNKEARERDERTNNGRAESDNID